MNEGDDRRFKTLIDIIKKAHVNTVAHEPSAGWQHRVMREIDALNEVREKAWLVIGLDRMFWPLLPAAGLLLLVAGVSWAKITCSTDTQFLTWMMQEPLTENLREYFCLL